MTTTLSIDFKKLAVIAIGAIFALSLFAAPVKQVEASTVEELQAQIAMLMEQLAELLGNNPPYIDPPDTAPPGGGGSCYNFSRSMYLGASDASTNGEVTKLQEYLMSTGDYTYGKVTGYYGPSTMAAVKRWQARNGVVSYGTPDSTGYGLVGKKTRAAMSRPCSYNIFKYDVYSYDTDANIEPGDSNSPVAVISIPAFSDKRYLNKLTVEFINHTGSDSVLRSFEDISLQVDGRTIYKKKMRDIEWERIRSDIRPRYQGVLFDSEEEGGGMRIPAGEGAKAIAKLSVDSGAADDTWIFTISDKGVELWSSLAGDVVLGDHDNDNVMFKIDTETASEPLTLTASDYDVQSGDSVTYTIVGDQNVIPFVELRTECDEDLVTVSAKGGHTCNEATIIEFPEKGVYRWTEWYTATEDATIRFEATGLDKDKKQSIGAPFKYVEVEVETESEEYITLTASDYDTLSGEPITYTIDFDDSVVYFLQVKTICDSDVVLDIDTKLSGECGSSSTLGFSNSDSVSFTETYTVNDDTEVSFTVMALGKYKEQIAYKEVEVDIGLIRELPTFELTADDEHIDSGDSVTYTIDVNSSIVRYLEIETKCDSRIVEINTKLAGDCNDEITVEVSGRESMTYHEYYTAKEDTEVEFNVTAFDKYNRKLETKVVEIEVRAGANIGTGSIEITNCELPDDDDTVNTCTSRASWTTAGAENVKVFVKESEKLMSAGPFYKDKKITWTTMRPLTLELMYGCTSNTMRSCEGSLDSAVLVASCAKGYVHEGTGCVEPDFSGLIVGDGPTEIRGVSTEAGNLANVISGLERLVESLRDFIASR